MLVNSGIVFQKAGENGSMFEKLPAGHYKYVPATPMTPAMFKILSAPTVPEKIYGNKPEEVERVLHTIKDRAGRNTGVMAVGEKGSGKTMFLNQINNRLVDSGFPVIHVNSAMPGSVLNEICALAERNVVFFVDEFEKLYDETENKKAQESLLTTMDGGVYRGNVFLLSANSFNVNHYMKDRPNRIHYTFKYESLPLDVLGEYLSDNLEDKSKSDNFMILHQNSRMNFDIMQNLVQEVNRFPSIPFSKIVKDMNLTVEVVGNLCYFDIERLEMNGYDILSKSDKTITMRDMVIKNRDHAFGNKDFYAKICFDHKKFMSALKKSGISFEEMDKKTDDYTCNKDGGLISVDEFYTDEDDSGGHFYGNIGFNVFSMTEDADGTIVMEGDMDGVIFTCVAKPFSKPSTIENLFKN